MEKKINEEMALNDIQAAEIKKNLSTIVDNDLYHIHSLADLFIGKYQEMVDSKQIIEPLDEASSPLLSIAEMIMEKSKACLDNADIIDSKFQERINLKYAAK